jgi:hypothetical protein
MYIAEMIREREFAVEKSEQHDLLSNLLEANDHDADLVTLTDSELICMFTYKSYIFQLLLTNGFFIANIYIFLVAGHEVRNSYFPLFSIKKKLLTIDWLCRRRQILCASHLRCWRCTPMNKRSSLNISSLLPKGVFRYVPLFLIWISCISRELYFEII